MQFYLKEQYGFLHHCVVYALTCQPDPLDVSSLTSYTTSDNMTGQFQVKLYNKFTVDLFVFNLELCVWDSFSTFYILYYNKIESFNHIFSNLTELFLIQM
jgi:hypothetical protein